MRLLPPYAVRGAPESVVREAAAAAASDEARWTGYTGLIIASRPRWRPNGQDGNRTTSLTSSARASAGGIPWSPRTSSSSPFPRRSPGWKTLRRWWLDTVKGDKAYRALRDKIEELRE